MRLQLTAALVLVVAARAAVVSAQEEPTPPAPPEADGGAPAPPPPPAPPPAEVAPQATREALPVERALNTRVGVEVGAYQDNNAVSVLTPSISGRVEDPVAGWSVNGRYLVDVVTAASPDIVSTASPRWSEVRQAGNLGGRYKPENFGVAANVAISSTPDYLSLLANAQLIQDLDEKNLTLSAGYGFGHDVIGRTATSFAVFSHKLDYHDVTLGVSRVINPALVLSVLADGMVERGDQSKPYRYVPIFTPAAAGAIGRGASFETVAAARLQGRPIEQLPLERERAALTVRLAWRLTSSTLRLEERGYLDTWNLHASTTDARWLFDATDRITWWPHVRLHVQNSVDFWQRAYVAQNEHDIPAFRTGDRELGALESVGLGGGIRVALGKRGRLDDWVFTGSLDGTYTSFADAIYVKDRISALAVTGLEVGF